jgi:hypothetical protein
MIAGPLAERRSEFTTRDIVLVDRPLLIELDGGLTIEVEPAAHGSEMPSGDWRATIRRGTSVLVATSRFPDDDLRLTTSDVVVITGELDADRLSESTAAAVVLRAKAADSYELAAASSHDPPPWFVRVSETEHARLRLTDQGVELPGSAVRFPPD